MAEPADFRIVAEHEQVGFDPFVFAGLPGQVEALRYWYADLSGQYRALVDVLLAAQQFSLTGVRMSELPDLLLDHLRDRVGAERASQLVADVDLDARLERLVAWKVVEKWQDREETALGFGPIRHVYQLTQAAAARHRALMDVEATAGQSTTTALVAPSIIADRLAEMLHHLSLNDPDGDRAADNAWATVQNTVREMARTAVGWQSQMAAGLAGAPDAGKLDVLQATLSGYVAVWGSRVDVHSAQIAEQLAALDHLDLQLWRRLVWARLTADADPAAIGGALDEHAETVAVLHAWFTGPHSQAARLRRQMRDAVPVLIRSTRTLLAVGGAASRRPELGRIAEALSAAGDDDAVWAVFCRATGLGAAQHLRGSSPELGAAGLSTSFWQAPPVPLDRKLRTHGARAALGRPSQIVDRAEGRRQARALAASRAADTARAEATLRAFSGRSLSQWTDLDASAYDMLLALLTVVRAARPGEHGVRRALSAESRWQLTLHPGDGGVARLSGPQGSLAVPDATLTMERA